eukprot:362220-Chlamydomonas_euryale.AAC.1
MTVLLDTTYAALYGSSYRPVLALQPRYRCAMIVALRQSMTSLPLRRPLKHSQDAGKRHDSWRPACASAASGERRAGACHRTTQQSASQRGATC